MEITSKCGKLQVNISKESMDRIKTFISLAPEEISGLGEVEFKNGEIFVGPIFLLKQKCTPVHTELNPEDVLQFMNDYDSQGGDLSKIRFWWHSHVDFSAFWSGTDTSTMDRFGQFGTDVLISYVGNKKGEYRCRIDIFKPVRMIFDGVPVNVVEQSEELREQCKKEMEEKVSFSPRTSSGTSRPSTGFGGFSPRSEHRSPASRTYMDWGDTDDLADLGMDLDGGEEDEEYVGEDLKTLREERRMSRSDVASALGIPLVNVFKVEEDEIPLTGSALEKFKKLIA